MMHFETLTAVAAPMVKNNIDTDQIFPARFSSRNRDNGDFGTYFFYDQRFDEEGNKRPDFILNDERLKNVKIIVAAGNYACGSGRPGAIYAHIDYGIQAVIAESFGPVMPTVAFKFGLLPIQIQKSEAQDLRGKLLETPGSEITIDLRSQTIIAPDGNRISFEIDHFVKRMFMEGLSEIELTLTFQDKINEFEAQHRTTVPWIFEQRRV